MLAKRVSILVIMLLTLGLLVGGSALAQEFNERLLITTATTGGTYYPIGVGMATLWTQELRGDGITVAATSSAGSGENVEMLRNHEADFAIMQGLFGRSVYLGVGMYDGRGFDGIRSIAGLWGNVEHFVLRNDSVNTGNVEDILGTRFVLGAPGSGTERSTLEIMSGLGWSRDDVDPEYVGYFEAADGMKDRRLDGASLVAGPPVAAVTDLFASGIGVTVLEFTDEQLAQINANSAYPGYQFVIDADTYPGQDEPINSIAQPNYLAAHVDVAEEVVYLLTKTLFENLDYMIGVHAASNEITLQTALNGLPVPLHPGAMRYFQDQGLEIPDNLIPPEAR